MMRTRKFAGSAAAFVCLLLAAVSFFSLRSVGAPSDPLDPSYAPSVDTSGIPSNVWVTGALAKVHPDATPGTQQSVQISSARNEFESFQIHVRAASNPIALSVTVSNFVNAQTGDVIASNGNVFVHREAYLDITTLSDANGTLGLTPDPLIPVKDAYLNEPRNAFPVTVPLNEVRSAWVDVLVPDTALSGYYTATVTVSDGASVLAAVPAVLKVWNFTLPSTASLKSAFGMAFDAFCVHVFDGTYNGCDQYPGSGGSADHGIELSHLAIARFFLDHRITISGLPYPPPPTGQWAEFDATYGQLLNGNGGTLLYGAKLTTLQYSPAGYSVDPSIAQDWVSHFSAAGWLPRLFHYTCDEPPNGCSWGDLPGMLQAVHAGSPSLKTLVTTDIASATQNNVLDGIDILVPTINVVEPHGGPNTRTDYDAWLSGGADRHLWWYQACGTHESCSNGTVGPASATWPSYMVDATPVRNRVFQWLAFINRFEAELYYQVDWCFATDPATVRCAGTDPWTNVYAFGGNGDGTLFYPGDTARIGGTTPIPISGIRLKLIRDGMEDYEYLKLLSDAGEDSFARSTAAGFITNSSTFSNDPQALTDAREALGNELHRLALQGAIQTPVIALSPATGGTATGLEGGPFSPASFQYQLSSSPGRANYSISGLPNWLTASSTSGTIEATGTAITFAVNAAANSLSAGTYSATIAIENATNGQGSQNLTVSLSVGALPALQVTPATTIAAAGNQGGTFVPNAFDYQVGATTDSVSYSITGVPSWLTASPTSGTATTSPTTITFSVNATASSLGVGTYNATITFSNATNGNGTDTRSATLTVNSTTGQQPMSRTWVSGTGNDNDPCTRTQPCLTFQAAHDKTSAGGEVNCLDSGGFGAIIITKAIAIICGGVQAGVLVAGTSAITVNAGPTDKVLLSGLDIEGLDTGINGVHVLQAGTVVVRDTSIRNFTGVGINLVASNSGGRAVIENVKLFNNAGGGFLLQGAGGVALGAAIIRSTFDLNGVAHIRVVGPASVSLSKNVALSPAVPSVQSSNGAAVLSFRNNVFRGSTAGITSTARPN